MVSNLDDREIIELFFERSEQAIMERSKKYGTIFANYRMAMGV